MDKTGIIFSLLLLLNQSHAQKTDEFFNEYQIDSLIALSKSQIRSKTINFARLNQAAAEKLVIEHFGKVSRPWASCLVNKARIAGFDDDSVSQREYLTESIRLWESIGTGHPDCSAAYNNMGNIYHDQAKEYDKAIELYQKALDVYAQLPTYSKKGYYTSLGNLGMAYSSIDMYSKAAECFTKTIDWYELNSSDYLSNYFTDADRLLNIYDKIDSTQKAEQLYFRILGLSENKLGLNHPMSLSLKRSLSLFYKRNGATDKSIEIRRELELVKSGILGKYYNRELTERLEFMDTDPVDVADSMSTIAYKALEQDDYKKALSALSGYVSVMLDHERTVNISVQEYYYLAALQKQFSNIEEAEKLLKYTIGLINKNTRIDELLLAECNDDLAYIYLENDNSAEAIPLFLRAGEILKRNYGVKHEAYLDNLNKLGSAYSDSRNYEESEKTYQEAISIYEDSLKTVNTNSLGVKVNLANLYVKMGRLDDAEKCYLNTYWEFVNTGDTTASYFYNCLSNTILLYNKMKPREDMIPWYIRNAEMKKSRYGRDTENYLEALVSITDLMREFKKHKEAEPYFQEQSEVSEKIEKGSVNYLGMLVNQGSNFIYSGRFEKAEIVLIEAKKMFEKYNLTTHEYYANCISSIGNIYLAKEEVDMGIGYLNQAKELYERYNHLVPNYTFCLQNILDFLPDSSQVQRLALNKRIIDLLRSNNDTLNVEYAELLNSAALLNDKLGNIKNSIPYHLRAIYLYEILGLESDIRYSGTLVNLAGLYNRRDQLEEAEKFYHKALRCMEDNNHTNHHYYANCIFNMASFYEKIGSFKAAEDYYYRTINMFDKVYSYDNENQRIRLMNIGGFMLRTGKYDLAYEMMRSADSLFVTSGDTISEQYAGNVVNLSQLFVLAGDSDSALKSLLRAKYIMEKYGLFNRINYAVCLSLLSDICRETGKTELAIKTLEQALRTLEQASGKISKAYMNNLYDLAWIEEQLGQYSEAEESMSESALIGSKLLENAANFMSERELDNYQNETDRNVERLCSFISDRARTGVNFDKYSGILYNQLLVSKGFLQGVAQKINLDAEKTPELGNLVSDFRNLKSKLSAHYAGMASEGDSVHVLEKKLEEVEKNLNRAVSKSLNYKNQVNWMDVRKSLKPGEAAMEFVYYSLKQDSGSDSIVYAATLIRPEYNSPVFIPICGEQKLYSDVVSISAKGTEMNPAVYRGIVVPAYKKELSKLHDIIWKPLEKYMDGINVIYYSPTGLIHRINLDAISIDKETRLGDKYNMLRLSSTRLLGESGWAKSNENNTASLYGGVEYDLDTTVVDLPGTQNNSLYRLNLTRGELLRGDSIIEKWDLLSGAAEEITQLSSMLTASNFIVEKFTQKNATEASFKQLGKQGISPRVIHIATHGFFYPNPVDSTSGSLDMTMAEKQPVFKMSDNPMMRSGLILYGANYAWKNKRTYKPGLEDGILTAYEISQTNLSNTELVVLSACETGLGDIQGNEGVYGLQRAFKIAGARYLMMSLWKVPDQETSDFMIQFYKNWLEKKMTIPEAFRLTQREIRQLYPDNPVNWAGFVLIE